MVFINALVAGLLLGPGVLGASISARTAVSKNNVNPSLGAIVGEYVPKNVRRQVAAHSTLKPIKLSQLDSFLNGRAAKRDTDPAPAGFVLTDKEKLVYGLAGDANSLVMANVTLLSTDGKPLINMESFESSTKNVVCGETMTLEFISKEAFDSAVAEWGWVNEDETHEFIMIANHESCSPADQRTPYLVLNADYDEDTFTATLDATRAEWKDIANTFNLDFGKVKLPATAVSRRAAAAHYDDTVSIDLTQTVRNPVIFSTTAGASGFDLTVSCLDCGTKGTLDVSGHIAVKAFSVEELSVEASPDNFEARLQIGVKVNGRAPNAAFSAQLLSVGLGGIDIPGIFTLGPTLDYDVGFSATLEGTAEISYGVRATISNDAVLKADLINPSNTQFTNWSPIIQQIPFQLNAVAKASITAFAQPTVALTFDVIGLPAFEAALKLKLPEVKADLSALANNGGVCGNSAKTAGVQVNASIGVDITFSVGTDAATNPGTIFEKELFSVNKPFFDSCIPLF